MKADLVILFSGGADSRLMVELAIKSGKKPYCVLVDYGQLHKEELTSAATQLEKINIQYQVVGITDLNVDSGLTGNGVKGRFEDVHEMHVPSRNLMFVGIAASIAENRGIDTVWYGANWEDYLNKFPDCMQEWFGRMNTVLEINGPAPIKLEAPISGFSKETVLELLKGFGVEEDEIFSGYGEL